MAEGTPWPGMGASHHQARGVGLDLGRHLAAPGFLSLPGSKGSGGRGAGAESLPPGVMGVLPLRTAATSGLTWTPGEIAVWEMGEDMDSGKGGTWAPWRLPMVR